MSLYRYFLPLVCALSSSGSCLSQPNFAVSTVTSTAGPAAVNVYAVDVNNDGITDIVQDAAGGQRVFAVSISNGDGTFKAPVIYKIVNFSFNRESADFQ